MGQPSVRPLAGVTHSLCPQKTREHPDSVSGMLSGIRAAPHALGTCFSRLYSSPGPQAKDTLADTDTLTEHTPGASIFVPNQASASWAALRQVTTWRGRLGAPETSLRVRTGGDAQISQKRLKASGRVASMGGWTSPPPGNQLSFP